MQTILLILANKGFLDNSQFNERPISKNFEVDNKNYELSLNKTSDNKVSVENLNQMNHLVKILMCRYCSSIRK